MTIQEEIKRVIANWMNPQYMKLHAGEMTAQEVRTVRAVVDCVGREIDALLIGHRVPKVRTSHRRNREEAARLQTLVDAAYSVSRPLHSTPEK